MHPPRTVEPSAAPAPFGAFLHASAEASALAALGSRAQRMPADPEGLTWTRGACTRCGGALLVGARGGKIVCARSDGSAPLCLGGAPLAPGAASIAGLLLVTVPGAGLRVAAGLAREPGLALAGGDGQSRIAAVWTAREGGRLEALVAGLLSVDADLVAVHLAFLGREEP